MDWKINLECKNVGECGKVYNNPLKYFNNSKIVNSVEILRRFFEHRNVSTSKNDERKYVCDASFDEYVNDEKIKGKDLYQDPPSEIEETSDSTGYAHTIYLKLLTFIPLSILLFICLAVFFFILCCKYYQRRKDELLEL
ncbi:hypothetical protein RF11_03693 [Thelohanellus kitauei]|uniref:Uncharacterized protein n=1 Tax=Thelohanellus kitauei TaxID=669202 RepID=A0A0C2JQ11_THEKT|nr:hypothetical protein RF11_03693 [Thelohanellus kitauei]